MADGILGDVPVPTNPRFKNLTGLRFGRLFVKQYVGHNSGHQKWLCLCDCGGTTVSYSNYLRTGRTRSCGCYMRQRSSEANIKHGGSSVHASKMMRKTHIAFGIAKSRCRNQKNSQYRNYGGRGIEFRFDSFEDFLAEAGVCPSPLHSIDRENNDLHYEKGNVRWQTKANQVRNRRVTLNVVYSGREMSLAEACELAGIKYITVYMRIFQAGWSAEKALSEPVGANLHLVEYMGQSMSLTQACRLAGLSFDAVKRRIAIGWPADKALSTPIRRAA